MSTLLCLSHTFIAITEGAGLEIVRDEFQVNQSVSGNQDHATISMNPLGVSMIVWHDFGLLDCDGSAIIGRSFDRNGNSLLDELIINDTSVGNQRVPDVDTGGDNPFIIAWDSLTTVAEGDHIYAKVFSESGEVFVNEMMIDEESSESKIYPSVAMYDNGDFIIIWDQEEQDQINYYVKFFDSNGIVIDGPIKVNTIPSDGPLDGSGRYGMPDIAVNSSGDTIVVWERISGKNISIAGRLFNPYTKTAAREILIDPPASGIIQRRPMSDINDAGDILVTWLEHAEGSLDTDIYVKKYMASISDWGDKICPHDDLADKQYLSVAKLTEAGQFLIVWTDSDPVYNDDVYMRIFSPRGIPLSAEILVNKTRDAAQKRPALDLVEFTDHVLVSITWESIGQDGDGAGIFSKLYRINY